MAEKIAEPRLISKRINQIRGVLGHDAKKPAIIETIPKPGYQIIASVGKPGYNNSAQRMPAADAGSVPAVEAFSRGLAHLGTQDYFAPWLPAATNEIETAVALDPEYSLARA